MAHYRYLIIGGGLSADAAAHGIRQLDAHGSIGLIGAEPDPPYDRPPLSKGLWQGKRLEKIWRNTAGRDVELFLGRTARRLDLDAKEVVVGDGTRYAFDKLLLATGGAPRRLPFDAPGVVYLRTLDDYRRLRELAEWGRRFAVIGGGFVGSEIAAALAMNGKEVVMIFPEETIGGRVFPSELGRFLNEFYRQQSVEVRAGETVVGLERRGVRYAVRTGAGATIAVDGVVAGLGIEPNTALARAAGLAVENGIIVDELLGANHPDVYAAGDVAAFQSAALGKRVRVEHEDNAKAMGERAGRNMAGGSEPYRHLPFFYSDLFELGYEAVGELDSRLETVTDWSDPYRKGVVYYLGQGRVRGVLLWNVWDRVDAARELVAERGPLTPAELRGRLAA